MTNENQNIEIQTEAILTCPYCETKQKVLMPTEQLQHYYKCTNEECASDLAPTEDNDCVFCSYADKVCPQKQLNPDFNKHKLQSLI